MENNMVQVKIWGKEVGLLYWDERSNNSVFQFNRDFLETGLDLSPIVAPVTSPTVQKGFPILGNKGKTYFGLPEFIADSLPDEWGNRVFKSWFENSSLKKKQITPVDRLSFIGRRAMGALEYYPAYIKEDGITDIELASLYELANKLFNERQGISIRIDDTLIMEDLYRVGTSAGGRRPKAVIGIDESTGFIRSGQADLPASYKYYILKFDTGKPEDFPFTKMEMAYYLMAGDAAIDMMPSRLVEIGGMQNFMTQRFDRENGIKLHIQTLAAMSSQADSYEDLFLIGRKLRLTAREQEQQFRRMVFNVVGSNVDDHQKNFSFMMYPDGKWKLSPAYDMIFSVDPDSVFNRSHELSISGKRSGITKQDLLDFASRQDIKNASNIIDSIAGVIANFNKYAEQVGINSYWASRVERVLVENEILKSKWQPVPQKAHEDMYICSNGWRATGIRFGKLKDGGFRLYATIKGETYHYNFSKRHEVSARVRLGKLSIDERNRLVEEHVLPKAIKEKGKVGLDNGLKQ